MRIVAAAILSFAFVSAACGGKAAPPPTTPETATTEKAAPEPAVAANDPAERVLAKMREHKADVCACRDTACADSAEKAFMDWAMERMDEIENVKPTKAQEEEAYKLAEESDACKARFASSSGGGASAGPTVTAAEILAAMEGFKNQICACKDQACVEKVETGMMDWAMKHVESMKHIKPTNDEEARADKIEGEMDACKAKIKP